MEVNVRMPYLNYLKYSVFYLIFSFASFSREKICFEMIKKLLAKNNQQDFYLNLDLRPK